MNLYGDQKTPKLAIGTLQWGTTLVDHKYINPKGVISENEVSKIVQIALENGIFLFDTAEGYGGGTSEKRIGRILKDCNDLKSKNAIVMTKFLPAPWRHSHKCFEKAVRESCRRLQVQCIPIYLLHSPVHWRPIEHWVEAAAKCKRKGLIQSLGLSNCDTKHVKRAYDASKKYGIDLACNQIHFSLLCFKSVELQETVTVCKELNIPVIGFTPLGQGLLTDKMSKSAFDESSNRTAKMLKIDWEDLTELRNEIKKISKRKGCSMAQTCLNWSISKGVIPLVGCRSVQQARDSLHAINESLELSEDEVKVLDSVALNRSTFRSSNRKRQFFVTLFGIVMVVCRALDSLGFGMVPEAGKILVK